MRKLLIILLSIALPLAIIGTMLYFLIPSATIISSSPADNEDSFDPMSNNIRLVFDKNPKKYFIEENFSLQNVSLGNSKEKTLDLDKKNLLKGTFYYNNTSIDFRLDNDYPLVPETSYQIHIESKNVFGYVKEYNINFKTKLVQTSELNQTQKEQILNTINVLEDGRVVGNEFVSKLPYETDEFLLTYKFDKAGAVIIYSVYYKETKAAAIKSVSDWLKSQGADINQLIINYYPYPG